MYVERAGERGPQVLLVHGSIVPGWQTWNAQRPLADHLRLVIPHRTGYPPDPPLERIDIDAQAAEIAALIEPGMHVVGHSYGGVVSLLAAALVPDRIRSLAVIEPPAFGLARGNPAVEELVSEIVAIYADTELSPRPGRWVRPRACPIRCHRRWWRRRTPPGSSGHPGKRRSHSTSWPTLGSQSSSSREATMPRSTPWPMCSPSGCRPSAL